MSAKSRFRNNGFDDDGLLLSPRNRYREDEEESVRAFDEIDEDDAEPRLHARDEDLEDEDMDGEDRGVTSMERPRGRTDGRVSTRPSASNAGRGRAKTGARKSPSGRSPAGGRKKSSSRKSATTSSTRRSPSTRKKTSTAAARGSRRSSRSR